MISLYSKKVISPGYYLAMIIRIRNLNDYTKQFNSKALEEKLRNRNGIQPAITRSIE